MSEHTSHPASSSHRWLNCPLSITKGNTIPDSPSSLDALLGTAAHSLAEFCLRKRKEPKKFLGRKIKVVDSSNGEIHKIEVDQKMIDGVTMYVDYCRDLIKEHKINKSLFGVETKNYVKDTDKEVGGTNDFHCVYGNTLEVVDYKNGVTEVDAEGNPQGVIYALALLDSIEHLQSFIDVIKITIVQPNSFSSQKIKTWSTNRKVLETFRKNIHAALKREKQHPNQTNSGPWCHWCKVESTCPQLYKDAEFLAAQEFSDSVDDYYIASIIESESRILRYIKKVKELAWDRMIARKEKIEGLKIVQGIGKRVLVDKNKVIEVLKKGEYKPSVYLKPQELLPMTKLEKVIKKEDFEKIIKLQEGKEIIVPVADKRPEYVAATEDFND